MSFILRRAIIALLTMFLVSLFCFLIFNTVKGDPALIIAGIDASQQQIQTLRDEMGLNNNVIARYLDWLFNFLKGDLGNSLRFRGEPISAILLSRLPVTATLALLSLFLILLISIPVSLLTVKKEGGLLDRIINIKLAACISMPSFFISLLFIWIFGLIFKIFSPGIFIDYKENFLGFLYSLFFPALSIAIPSSAIMIKFLRSSLFQELKCDYVRTAKSKGCSRSLILKKHVLKNASLPAITIFGMIIAEVFSGSIIIEQVFTIPGLGRLLIASISSRDYPLIQTLMVYIAFIVVAANTLADIAIMTIDPRIRLAGKKIR